MELYRREGKERKGEERSSSPLTTVSILLPFVKQCTAQTLSASPEKRRKIAFFFLTVTRAGGMADRLGRRRRGPSARRKDRELVVEKLSGARPPLYCRENFGWPSVDFLIELQRQASGVQRPSKG